VTLLADLVETSAQVRETTGRLAKVQALANCLKTLDPPEIECGVAYLAGELPQGRMGIGLAVLRNALAEAASSATLEIGAVDRSLAEIAGMRGAGATSRRTAALRELFSLATATEQEFLLRLLTGELRQGALAGVMIDAIAAAADVTADEVRRAVMYAPSLGVAAHAALLDGSQGLRAFDLKVLKAFEPMLAQSAADTREALERLGGEVALEWKMDGARIQAHKSGDTVRLYTRSLNEVTHAIPEVADVVRASLHRELILDGEAIALDADGRPLPFQVTMRRFGRKLDVERMRSQLPIRAYFFDCLWLDGRSLVGCPARERHVALSRAILEASRMPRLVTNSMSQAQAYYDGAVAAGHEGLVAKSLDAPYEAGNRGASWLKIKRVHTLDLVVLAAEWGHGRRTGKLSNLHLGAFDPDTGTYVMLGKTFKGLTDAMLDWQTRELLAREIRRDRWTVYVRPELVVEIAFSDLQASPRYPGGIALRLARVRRYRDDKRADQADTMVEVRRVFAAGH
jgi:ATP-dependent DNA ligase I